ncbi:MAG: PorT family protein [Tannerellaceae bacterium]|nr:PorT family protein [Tannerellaceae bacterium]
MRIKRILIIIGIVIYTMVSISFAQEMNPGVDFSFVVGLNIGATTPVPIPKELDITRYNPKFNPKLGANLAYFFNDRWGIGTGLTLDWKGMNVHTKVDEVHLTVDVPNTGTLTGYVTGKNKTQVNTVYLTQPIYGLFRINPKWQLKGGIYLEEALHRKFKGEVSDVEIFVESPVMQKREFSYATLDYSDHARKFDIGLLVGGEFRMNQHVGFFADFNWAFIPYFSSNVPIHFTMRNVYFSFGATYRIKSLTKNR